MLIMPFTSPEVDLSNAGGKGLNLACLTQSGFPVPPGFILATDAYRDFVDTNQLRGLIKPAVEGLAGDDTSQLEVASSTIREAFSLGVMPTVIETKLRAAYEDLGRVPVAVRSSATTEDLPDLSFAGQQDTFLNIIDEQALTQAVVACWSSLWTARAIGYRVRNGIDHGPVALAVVVQQMVLSDVSGVLFTANPLTGLLSETVIDATFGLGEALVTGRVDPDHFVVDGLSGKIVDQSIGQKKVVSQTRPSGGVELVEGQVMVESSLSKNEIEQLLELGKQVQQVYGYPQDLEWAFAGGELYLLQSRAITTLFPVPEISLDPLIVWLSFGAVQGIMEPITPLGRDLINHLIAGAGRMFRLELDPDTQQVFDMAGERIWARINGFLRHPVGIKLVGPIFQFVEPSVGRILGQLIAEPHLGAGSGKFKLSTLARLAYFALPIAFRSIRNFLDPEPVRPRFEAMLNEKFVSFRINADANQSARLSALANLIRSTFLTIFPALIPHFVPILGPSMAALNLLNRMAGEDRALVWEVMRAVPGNVTSEMDLALYRAAVTIQKDTDSARVFSAGESEALVEAYKAGMLPPVAQAALRGFMEAYGMRGVGEIDFGQPRWREQPEPIIATVKRYMEIEADDAPDALFARGESAANEAIGHLVASVRNTPFGWLKAKVVKVAARRIRLFMGLRESPKFFIVRLMGMARQELLDIGALYVGDGILSAPDDLVYLTLEELKGLARGEESDWQAVVAERRAAYAFELRRRQVPRVLVSDGRTFYEGVAAIDESGSVIIGSPVSPGVVEGVVRVVLDARKAHLVPGEILVCPGTDPAWTPLLMAAGGLITEVGGLMTHGSVVAREFGIPAVVGIHQATERLEDGQRIRIDGTSGEILLLNE